MQTDKKIAELIDKDDVKALYFGYEYHTPEAAESTVGEAGITNGVVRVLTSKDCIVQGCTERASRFQKDKLWKMCILP